MKVLIEIGYWTKLIVPIDELPAMLKTLDKTMFVDTSYVGDQTIVHQSQRSDINVQILRQEYIPSYDDYELMKKKAEEALKEAE